MALDHEKAKEACTKVDPTGILQDSLRKRLTSTQENLANLFKQIGNKLAIEKIYDAENLKDLILLSCEVVHEYSKNTVKNYDSLHYLTQNLNGTSPEYLTKVAVNNLYFGLDSFQNGLIGDLVDEILE